MLPDQPADQPEIDPAPATAPAKKSPGRRRSAGKRGSAKNKPSAAGSQAKSQAKSQVRYAVVGLGHIAQAAILPGFQSAKSNSVLAALVSDDPEKLKQVGDAYSVEHRFGYDDFEECLRIAKIDAVFIALPNSMHEEFAVRAAEAGVHVLCEKPLAVTSRECETIVRTCKEHDVLLMTAYRLHFEPVNLKAVEICQSGEIGELRIFSSTFTMQVTDTDNIRLRADAGGGPLHDIGIYCINAARGLFRSEPREVFAWAARSGDPRFREVPESVTAIMRFGAGQLAQFTCSFGAADTSEFRIIGTRGDVRLEPAYDHSEPLKYSITVDGKSREVEHSHKDQFGAELLYFSECILKGKTPEPSGEEGAADVRIIRAMQWSVDTGEAVALPPAPRELEYPSPQQRIARPAVPRKRLVKVESATG